MKNRLFLAIAWLTLAAMLLSACGGLGDVLGGPTVTISIAYGSEKREWLEPLVAQYNDEKHKLADGRTTIAVEATAMGSVESVDQMLAGTLKPTVWSPASSIYVPVANAEWRKQFGSDIATGTPNDLVLSPVVIAMWKPMAEALGWPNTPIGWADIAQLAISDEGWAAYNYPEWGSFKFGHTHPEYSNSGVVSILAEAYAGAGKQRDLTVADLQQQSVKDFMAEVESSIIHYGTSTGFFGERMFGSGPSYLSAAVLYENLIVAQETKRLAGQVSQTPVVAIYPKEGTFWSNHPYIIVNASWVTPEQKEAAQLFETFLLDKPQQLKAIELGFRPADVSIPLAAPLDAAHGVDVSQPQTVLEVPSADVIQATGALWEETKKPVDLMVVMDISGSMAGDKIASARSSLAQFVTLLDDRDRLQINLFNHEQSTLTDLSSLGDKRDEVTRRVEGIFEDGGTALYDAVITAHQQLTATGDPSHIRAIVVLSDGQDRDSSSSLQDAINVIGNPGEQGGNAIKVFTIAFGADADSDILKQLAESTGGQEYDATPESIQQIYAQIATFF